MARTKRIPMHFPYQGPQSDRQPYEDQVQPPKTSSSHFERELTASAEDGDIEFYRHPLYLAFLADHASGISTARPQMGTEELTVDQLTRMLFAAIPNGFRQESIEFEEPFMTKDGQYPVAYRHPDFLEYKEENDPKFRDLQKVLGGLETGILRVRNAVEDAIAIYSSSKVGKSYSTYLDCRCIKSSTSMSGLYLWDGSSGFHFDTTVNVI